MLKPQSNRASPSFTCFPSKRTCVLILLLLSAPILYVVVSSGTASSEGSYDAYIPTRFSLEEMRNFAFQKQASTDFRSSLYTRLNLSFSRIMEDINSRFDISGNDVMVFVHIQKTAGTSFEKFLVKYLEIESPCDCSRGRRKCTCWRPNKANQIWLFSRYSTGWLCGLHADYTELYASGCVSEALDRKEGVHRRRRYFYTSFLREPVARFISEFRHVNRGATWIAARHMCNGRPPTPDELPLCFDPESGWDGVEMDEFLHCPFNLAFNRQTRMLADLTLVNCYSRTAMDMERKERIMLQSAKNNLRNLAYFGIKERMADSQYMFEQLFSVKFTRSLSDWHRSKSNNTVITEKQLELIRERNALDIELYDYAIQLFDERLRLIRNREAASRNASAPSVLAILTNVTLKQNASSVVYETDSDESTEESDNS